MAQEQSVKGSQVVLHGPYGGKHGKKWDDGEHDDGVKKIVLSHKEGIGTFSVTYADDKEYKHPSGDSSYKRVTINLDSDEFIEEVSGYTGNVKYYGEIVRSLKIKTNKRTYGPYGVDEGKRFSVEFPSGHKFVGFEGSTSSHYLISIGFYDKC